MAELKKGDRVKFLNEKGSGLVTRLIDRQMVMVRTEDGFEYPVLRSELISTSIDEVVIRSRDEGEVQGESVPENKKNEFEKSEPKADSKNVTLSGKVNVFLAVEPHFCDEPVGGEADILLINDSPYSILYHCVIMISESLSETISAGMLEPDTKLIIGTEHLDDLFGGGRGLAVSYIPYGPGRHIYHEPVAQSFKPGREYMAARSSYTENEFTEGDSWLVRIEQGADPDDIGELASQLVSSFATREPKKEDAASPVAPRKKVTATEEVDLHIGEIVDNISGLTPGEILNTQIARFRTSLDGAVRARQKKIVFIHGTGEGKLKHEIRRIIDREYPRCNYQDASFKEYGYGATMVIIR